MIRNAFVFSLGATGMLVTIIGTLHTTPTYQSLLFLIGATLLLFNAIANQLKLFIAFEVVIVMSTILSFFPLLPNIVKGGIPLTLGILLILIYAIKRWLIAKNDILGCLSLLILAMGFATLNPWVYLVGGIAGLIYAYIEYQKDIHSALFWVILNGVFIISTSLSLIQVLQ